MLDSFISPSYLRYKKGPDLNLAPPSPLFLATPLSKNDNFKQTHLFYHFKTVRHKGFLYDVVITFIDKTDGCGPTKRIEVMTKTLILIKALLHATTTPTYRQLSTPHYKNNKIRSSVFPSLVFNRKFSISELKSKYMLCPPEKRSRTNKVELFSVNH